MTASFHLERRPGPIKVVSLIPTPFFIDVSVSISAN